MKLKIYSAKNYGTKLKVTIQETGKLGFTKETAESLQLSNDTYIKIAEDEETQGDLYMIVCNKKDEDGFKANCNAGYYSLYTTILFKEMGIDFVNQTVIFDLSREEKLDKDVDGRVYKMHKRIKNKKRKEDGTRI